MKTNSRVRRNGSARHGAEQAQTPALKFTHQRGVVKSFLPHKGFGFIQALPALARKLKLKPDEDLFFNLTDADFADAGRMGAGAAVLFDVARVRRAVNVRVAKPPPEQVQSAPKTTARAGSGRRLEKSLAGSSRGVGKCCLGRTGTMSAAMEMALPGDPDTTTLFLDGATGAAALMIRENGRRRTERQHFSDPHAALDYCLARRYRFVFVPASVDSEQSAALNGGGE